MKNIKYTSDGKKVVVIGKLNSHDTIVQEIFVSENSEIPSGEQFVVKSLHDAPVISWKEKSLLDIEKRYEKEKEQNLLLIERANKEYRLKSAELKAKLNYIGIALKNANEGSFKTLVDYITGEIEWIVIQHYDIEIVPINEFHQMYENSLRLISLFGKDDGTFTYAVGDYYDYSGGNKKFHPFKNYDEAFLKFKELVLASSISEKNIAIAEKYGFELNPEKLKKYKEDLIEIYSKYIIDHNEKINNWEQSIEKLK